MKTYEGMEVHLNLSTPIYEYESASHFGHLIQVERGPGTLSIGDWMRSNQSICDCKEKIKVFAPTGNQTLVIQPVATNMCDRKYFCSS
jgi:hypothetical protein